MLDRQLPKPKADELRTLHVNYNVPAATLSAFPSPRILAIRRVNSSEAFEAAFVRVCRVTGLPLWGMVVKMFISVAIRVATFTNG